MPEEDDDCPICYDAMGGPQVSVDSLTFCDECGKAVHTECFRQWSRTAHQVTCVYCRTKFVTPQQGGGGGEASSPEGYLNLASVAGIDSVRDTSSYYSGPRAGQRYWSGYGRY